jgi:hypothetical protein
MPKLSDLHSTYISKLARLIAIDKEYQAIQFSSVSVLNTSIEYVFLDGYKCWENFIEEIFISYTTYNKPISGKTPESFLKPTNEEHALDLLKLEKTYLDWTSPDNIIKRAEICFKSHQIITQPIQQCLSDLRDAKKIRNCIAHGSKESNRIFNGVCRQNLGKIFNSPGEYLNHSSPDKVNHYNIYYLNLFKNLVSLLSQ